MGSASSNLTETLSVSLHGLLPLLFPILGRSRGTQVFKELSGHFCHIFNGLVKRSLIGRRWLREAADLSYELEGCSLNFVVGGWGVKVEQCPDVAAHPEGVGPDLPSSFSPDENTVDRGSLTVFSLPGCAIAYG